MIKNIKHQEQLLALVIPASHKADGVEFFTPDSFSQQLAYMHHPVGHKIDAHRHNHISREVNYTQEVLIMRKGRLRVDFYSDEEFYLKSYVLNAGDVILLINGGHGFQVLEEVEIIEVKQGPYVGDIDKTRFTGIDYNTTDIKLEE